MEDIEDKGMRAAEALTLLGFQATLHFLFLSSFRYLSVGGQYFQPVSKSHTVYVLLLNKT